MERVCAWMGRWRMLDKYVVADGAGWKIRGQYGEKGLFEMNKE